MRPLICFTSDFGLDDTWVGVCHAVIKQGCPDAHVVDLSHGVPPYDVRKGAAVAASGVHQLPGAIHIVVVDPGRGRRASRHLHRHAQRDVSARAGQRRPSSGGRSRGRYRRRVRTSSVGPSDREPAPTFHARDVLCSGCGCDRVRNSAVRTRACRFRPANSRRRHSASACRRAATRSARCSRPTGSARCASTSRASGSTNSACGSARLEIGLGHNALDVPFARTFSDAAGGRAGGARGRVGLADARHQPGRCARPLRR